VSDAKSKLYVGNLCASARSPTQKHNFYAARSPVLLVVALAIASSHGAPSTLACEGILAYHSAMTLDPSPKMEGGMLSSDLYRQFMADCLRWAKAARNDKDRETYLQLARTWHEAALQIERGLGLIAEGQDLVERSRKVGNPRSGRPAPK